MATTANTDVSSGIGLVVQVATERRHDGLGCTRGSNEHTSNGERRLVAVRGQPTRTLWHALA